MSSTLQQIRAAARGLEAETIDFLQALVRTPSLSGNEEAAIALVEERMIAVGFDQVRRDPFGNVWGRIGSGRHTVACDAHLDTVDVGDRRLWKVDPFGAEIRDGILYGRGASDQKAGMAALVYAGALLKQIGFESDLTIWMVGSVREEDCDGLCWHYILSEGLMRPDLVVLTEPTNLQVYRGQRGRMEIEVTLRGVSCHGSAPQRGINAIHRMAPVVAAIDRLQGTLATDDFLGAGSITTSQIRSVAPSLCAVADQCTIHLDRRLTAGETDRSAIAEIAAILQREAPPPSGPAALADDTRIEVPEFRGASYTGLVYPMRQYFPAWTLPADHPLLREALAARRAVLGATGTASGAGKWAFSTNGVATRGLHGIPTLGFGPANEIHAHSPDDQCPLNHLVPAVAFYATYISRLADAPAAAWAAE